VSNQIPVFIGTVDMTGKLRLDENARFGLYVQTLKSQTVQVTVKKRGTQRSLDQNAWAWGVAYPIIAEEIGYDRHEHDELHYALVAKCFGEHFDKRVGAMVPNKRSSKLTTKEFSEYMDWLVRFAATDLGGILVPLPGESVSA